MGFVRRMDLEEDSPEEGIRLAPCLLKAGLEADVWSLAAVV